MLVNMAEWFEESHVVRAETRLFLQLTHGGRRGRLAAVETALGEPECPWVVAAALLDDDNHAALDVEDDDARAADASTIGRRHAGCK